MNEWMNEKCLFEKPQYKYEEDIKNNKSRFSEMDTQVHNAWPLTCAQHKNFVNMSEIKQNQVTIYIRKQYKS